MENVYKPTEFNCSNNIPIKEYFSNYAELLLKDEPSEDSCGNEAIAKMLGVSVKEVSQLAKNVR